MHIVIEYSVNRHSNGGNRLRGERQTRVLARTSSIFTAEQREVIGKKSVESVKQKAKKKEEEEESV